MTSVPEPGSLVGDSSDQCVDMEDITASSLTEEQRCTKISGLETQIQIFDARKDYVLKMIEIDKKNKHPLPETMPKLEGELKFVKEKIIFLEGDFNATHTSWGCTRCDTRGRKLYSYIINNNIDLYAPPTPTRYGTASATTIDYALVKNLNWPCTIESIPELSSDHNPINLRFPRTTQFQLPPPKLTTTWSKFRSILSNPNNFYLPDANSTDEVDTQVDNLTNEILSAHASASKPVLPSEPPFVQGELKELIKARNRAKKTWQTTRHPQHKTELNRLQNKIKRKTYLYRQQVWEETLSTLSTEDNSLWGTARAFRRKAAPISALNGPDGTALSDTHKTDLIANSLERQFQINDIHNPHKDEIISNIVDAILPPSRNYGRLLPPDWLGQTPPTSRSLKNFHLPCLGALL
ncbi:hypothetical protein TNCT_437591 [Trichonephila clavata]|uniref:Endonuclease/exonuclease/phosphatase domain-containing protein n=1 Tax=Trichonephila clavata TaxID=2740835 RepID=A0A8X6LJ47_TRICU|nr:hypothetical protein TNCT_437591 [Trichonephila clavata]